MTIPVTAHIGTVFRRKTVDPKLLDEIQRAEVDGAINLTRLAMPGEPLPSPQDLCPQDEHLFSFQAGLSEFDMEDVDGALKARGLVPFRDYVFTSATTGVIGPIPEWLRCHKTDRGNWVLDAVLET